MAAQDVYSMKWTLDINIIANVDECRAKAKLSCVSFVIDALHWILNWIETHIYTQTDRKKRGRKYFQIMKFLAQNKNSWVSANEIPIVTFIQQHTFHGLSTDYRMRNKWWYFIIQNVSNMRRQMVFRLYISFMCMIWWLSSFGFFESYEQMKSHTLKSFNHIRNCWLISGIWCPSMLRVLWISSHVFWHLAKELNLKRFLSKLMLKKRHCRGVV